MTAFEVAQELLKLGYEEPNCYACQHFRQSVEGTRGTCDCMIARGIIPLAKALRKAQNNPSGPLFPVISFAKKTDDGIDEEITIPALVGSQVGVAAGSLQWPEYYDPISILFCAFFERVEPKQSDD